MEITAAAVKELRDKTGLGMMKCKEALAEAEGNIEKAVELLRKRAASDIIKRAAREAREGTIGTYVHHDHKLAVIVELNCETDFVAKTDDFLNLAKDLSMHIAAANPTYLAPEDIPAEIIDKEKEIYREQVADKPPKAIESIITGKLNKYYEDNCLLNQLFVKDTKLKIQNLLEQVSAKSGEKIAIRRFARFRVGE